LEEVTADLSRVAEAAIIVAWQVAVDAATARFGMPNARHGAPARAAVLAFGKLGGSELNYSSDIDLMLVYDEDGLTDGRRPAAHDEFFARAAAEMIRLLSAHTDRRPAYPADFRPPPAGQPGPAAPSPA